MQYSHNAIHIALYNIKYLSKEKNDNFIVDKCYESLWFLQCNRCNNLNNKNDGHTQTFNSCCYK